MCEKSRESVDHLLLYCEMASALWNTIFSLVGLAWVMSSGVVDLFACWKGQFGRLWNVVMQKMILSCLMQCLWRERNYWSFEVCQQTMEELKDFSFKTLYHWTIAFSLYISFLFFFFLCDFISSFS